MDLIPIQRTLDGNQEFLDNPDCLENLPMTLDFFELVGYRPPWIGYFARVDGYLVGSAAFKGGPRAGQVEIAYGIFPGYQHRGYGTEVCRQLVLLGLKTDPTVRITARTLPENNESARILQKNGFVKLGMVWEEGDGDVWEWAYQPDTPADTFKSSLFNDFKFGTAINLVFFL